MGQNLHEKFTPAQNEVRLAIMDFIIDRQRPFHLQQDGFAALPQMRLSTKEDFPCIVDTLRQNDGMVVDEAEQVHFIYPVSALPTAHRVTLADGRSFTAMCAIDALGAAFTFRQDVEVNSVCGECGKPVRVLLKDQKLAAYSPEDLHVLTFRLEDIVNWAGSCWNVMQFFCTENEFYAYTAKMGLNMATVIKADIHRAVQEARATFALQERRGLGKNAVPLWATEQSSVLAQQLYKSGICTQPVHVPLFTLAATELNMSYRCLQKTDAL